MMKYLRRIANSFNSSVLGPPEKPHTSEVSEERPPSGNERPRRPWVGHLDPKATKFLKEQLRYKGVEFTEP